MGGARISLYSCSSPLVIHGHVKDSQAVAEAAMKDAPSCSPIGSASERTRRAGWQLAVARSGVARRSEVGSETTGPCRRRFEVVEAGVIHDSSCAGDR